MHRARDGVDGVADRPSHPGEARYSARVGRLDDIIARNKRPTKSRERLAVMIGCGLFLLLILVLMVFTDLGRPPVPQGREDDRGRVREIYIRRAAPRDAR
ncbi:MAG: hypothetical protein JWO36_4985 [Myxococcales bacterium]|nr:hypothetical protein [Myxococcales bacterium]